MSDIDKVKIGSYIKILPGFAFDSSYFTDENQGMPLIRIRDLENEATEAWFTGNYDEKYVIRKDDILVGMDGDFLVAKWKGNNALLNQRVCKLETIDQRIINQEFLYYSLIDEVRKINQVTSATTVKHLSTKNIQNLEIWLPKQVEEQAKIAEVLATIDRAIAQTEALIAKHQRIKTGLMQDLLTRGIDEHGQLRDPSTHRFKSTPLGMIPEEWEVSNIGKISHRVTSGSRWWARYYSDTGAKFIRIGNLTREHVNLRLQNIQHVQPPDSSEAKRTVLETGDLLISVTADLGIIGIVPSDLGEAYINQHIALVKLDKEKINPYFIGNLLSSFQAQKYFSLLNDSGAKAGLNLKTISAFPVVFPSDKKEQDRIAEIIQKTDDIIEKQKSERKKLLGVKAGLMQDLLSGRVSVKVLME